MILQNALRAQYARTMEQAYAFARSAIVAGAATDFLDCGSGSGHEWEHTLREARASRPGLRYRGIEWAEDAAAQGRANGLDITTGDLNDRLPVESSSQDRVLAFSVLEHLLMPCRFLTEAHRVLRPGGRLVILTPNISTWFTALAILLGRMPSSGPHPDSNSLRRSQEFARVSDVAESDLGGDTPEHRHLVVFSYAALKGFLVDAGFDVSAARGFGYYPFPRAIQPLFERIDPWHCHQMVMVCEKR